MLLHNYIVLLFAEIKKMSSQSTFSKLFELSDIKYFTEQLDDLNIAI